MLYFPEYGLHFAVYISQLFGVDFEPFLEPVRNIVLGFIFQLVLQACPHIHCYGSYLYLRLDVFRAFGEEYGDGNDEMQTSVAVFLWIFVLILGGDKRNVVLTGKQLGDIVNIVDVIAYYPYSGHVEKIFPYG